MRDTDLFRMALGIEPPWLVTKSEFDAAAKRPDIHLDFRHFGVVPLRDIWRPIAQGLQLLSPDDRLG